MSKIPHNEANIQKLVETVLDTMDYGAMLSIVEDHLMESYTNKEIFHSDWENEGL